MIDVAKMKSWSHIRCYDCGQEDILKCPARVVTSPIWKNGKWIYVRRLCKFHEKKEEN